MPRTCVISYIPGHRAIKQFRSNKKSTFFHDLEYPKATNGDEIGQMEHIDQEMYPVENDKKRKHDEEMESSKATKIPKHPIRFVPKQVSR
jgi:hypothetical protein